MSGLKSFSGYGAIVDSIYSLKTRTHERVSLNEFALQEGEFDSLGAQVIVTVPEEFLVPIDALPGKTGAFVQLAEGPGTDPVLPGGNVPLPQLGVEELGLASPAPAISRTAHFRWFFGTELRPTAAELVLTSPAEGQLVRAGVVQPDGSVRWHSPVRLGRGTLAPRLALPRLRAVGVVVELLRGSVLGPAQIAVATDGRAYLVAGALARAVTPKTWARRRLGRRLRRLPFGLPTDLRLGAIGRDPSHRPRHPDRGHEHDPERLRGDPRPVVGIRNGPCRVDLPECGDGHGQDSEGGTAGMEHSVGPGLAGRADARARASADCGHRAGRLRARRPGPEGHERR